MADFTQLHHRIWQNLQFTDLSIPAQLLYLTCMSHPTITHAGVLDWRPRRIAQLAQGWTPELVETAGQELEQARFLIIDRDTEEAFVRSFYRNDGILKQTNLSTSAARAILKVASREIHRHITHELHRLHNEHPHMKGFDSPELWQYMQDNPDENPPDNHPKKPQIHPTIDPPIHPSNDPNGHPKIDPTIDPQILNFHPTNGGSNGGSPTPIHHYTNTPSGVEVNRNQQGARNTTPKAAPAATPKKSQSKLEADGAATPAPDVDPADARCAQHRGLPAEAVPPCRGCKAAREHAERVERARELDVRVSRRAAIDGCSVCDELGFVQVVVGLPGGGEREVLVRCDHGGSGSSVVDGDGSGVFSGLASPVAGENPSGGTQVWFGGFDRSDGTLAGSGSGGAALRVV